MAKRRRRKQNSNLPKWVLSAFAAAAVILSVITFGGDMIGIDTSFAQECMNFIDRILYGGPTSPAPTLPASGELKVYVIDVGQGESILITTEENSLLIDAGENDKGDEVLDFIKQLGLTELDYVLATHPDSDHIGGMDTVLENIDVPGGVFFGEMPDDLIPTTKTYARTCWMSSIEKRDFLRMSPGDTIDPAAGGADRSGAGGTCRQSTARTTPRRSPAWTLAKAPSSLTATRRRIWRRCWCRAAPISTAM